MRIRFGSLIVVLTATVVAFLPVLQNGFVNWDDPFTLVGNPRLDAPGVVRWSFTTTEMGHYQPLAWLAWSQWKALFGLDPTAFHALSLLGHLVNVALVYVLCIRLTAMTGLAGTGAGVAAIVAAFTFAVHPIRVEAVAWASAFPYVLSLALLLLSFLAYLRHWGATRRRAGWLWVSVGAFALSQLARASAPAFPLVLWLADVYLHRGRVHRQPRPDQPVGHARLLWEKAPFLLVAIGAVFVESRARELATLEEAGLGLRLTLAATAPFTYLWRTLAPVRLSPLDPLPLEAGFAWVPLVPALLALALMTMGLWRVRGRYAGLAVAWAAYLLLLAPVAGLTSERPASHGRPVHVRARSRPLALHRPRVRGDLAGHPGAACRSPGGRRGAPPRPDSGDRGRRCRRGARRGHVAPGHVVARLHHVMDTRGRSRSPERHRDLQSRRGAGRGGA